MLPPLAQRGLLPVGIVAFCAWLAWLGVQGWDVQQALDTPRVPASTALNPSTPAHLALDPHAIAELFGAVALESLDASPQPVALTLLASLSESRAVVSRALIESPEGSAFYRLGDRLPGGARLKAVHPDHVLIQLGGHERRLSFPRAPERLLAPRTAP